jgi:dephospho-CoA kinase
MDNIITIGITGGIGSGKTYVCRIIEAMGHPVFYSDIVAKDLLTNNDEVIRQITECFGPSAYSNGNLNKSFIASKIFQNENLRASINNIVHPAVRKAFSDWSENQESNLVFNEAAILFETDSYKNFDYTILITASDNIRISRIKKRDNLSEEEIQKRLDAQWDDKKKIPLASFVINNNESELLVPKIIEILKIIKDEQTSI